MAKEIFPFGYVVLAAERFLLPALNLDMSESNDLLGKGWRALSKCARDREMLSETTLVNIFGRHCGNLIDVQIASHNRLRARGPVSMSIKLQ